MNKLKLDLNELQVESFGTLQADDKRGTVDAQNTPPYTQSCDGSCVDTCISCADSCYNTCQLSCAGTCDTCAPTCEFHCTHRSVC